MIIRPWCHDRWGVYVGACGKDGQRMALTTVRQVVGGLTRRVAREVASRVPTADLDEQDPDYIRNMLPGAWLVASLYFRAEVRGLEHVPAEGPVLLVGNHSGGNLTPDTTVFTLAFTSYFGAERCFYQLAHNVGCWCRG